MRSSPAISRRYLTPLIPLLLQEKGEENRESGDTPETPAGNLGSLHLPHTGGGIPTSHCFPWGSSESRCTGTKGLPFFSSPLMSCRLSSSTKRHCIMSC